MARNQKQADAILAAQQLKYRAAKMLKDAGVSTRIDELAELESSENEPSRTTTPAKSKKGLAVAVRKRPAFLDAPGLFDEEETVRNDREGSFLRGGTPDNETGEGAGEAGEKE